MAINSISRYLLIVSILLFNYHKSFAQEVDRISTDRPDQTETADIVPIGYFQWESGFVWEHVNNSNQNITFNSSLFKVGLLENLELRVITEFAGTRVKQEGGNLHENGFKPLAVGTKIAISKESTYLPQISLISHLSFSGTSSKQYEIESIAPDFRFVITKSINEKLALSTNLGAEWDGVSSKAIGVYTLALGFSLTQHWGGYIESYGFLPEDGPADHRADGGLTYLIGQNILLDTSAGFALTKGSPEYFVGCGFSLRLPN